jgi:hypothetical protein
MTGYKTQKAKGRPATGRPFFQGRIVPTEVQKTIRTFWKKSYGRLKGSVKEFFQNKCLSFQQLNEKVNTKLKMTLFVTLTLSVSLSPLFFSDLCLLEV